MSVFSALLEHAVDGGRLEVNRARGTAKLYVSDRADRIWLPADEESFRNVASVELQLALTLAVNTGQREGDLLRLTWSAYDGNALTLKQSKTGATVWVPCTQELKDALAATPRRAVTILTNQRGRSWTEDGFRASWRKASRKAGITTLTFNDLRGTAVTRLAEAGCDVPQIAAITGHTLRSAATILESYLARTRPLASAAIQKLERNRG